MIRFLLDTDHVSLQERGHLPLLIRLRVQPPEALSVSIVTVQESEVKAYKWASLAEARQLITYAQSRNLFDEVIKYLAEHGVTPYEWLRHTWDSRDAFPVEVANIFKSFRDEIL